MGTFINELEGNLWELHLKSRVSELSRELVNFMNQTDYKINEDFDSIVAFDFEMEGDLDLTYVGYPNPEYQGHWMNTAIINVNHENDREVTTKIIEEINSKHKIKVETLDDFWVSIKELQYRFFRTAWINAVKQTRFKKLGFFIIHDLFRGIDCQTGEKVNEEQIEEIIEKFKKENEM